MSLHQLKLKLNIRSSRFKYTWQKGNLAWNFSKYSSFKLSYSLTLLNTWSSSSFTWRVEMTVSGISITIWARKDKKLQAKFTEINCQKATGTMYNTVNVSSIFRGICLRSNAKSASSRHTATSFAILSNLPCLDGHHKTSVKSEEVDKTREVQCTSYKCVPWWKCQRKYSLFCFRSRNPSAASIYTSEQREVCLIPCSFTMPRWSSNEYLITF